MRVVVAGICADRYTYVKCSPVASFEICLYISKSSVDVAYFNNRVDFFYTVDHMLYNFFGGKYFERVIVDVGCSLARVTGLYLHGEVDVIAARLVTRVHIVVDRFFLRIHYPGRLTNDPRSHSVLRSSNRYI